MMTANDTPRARALRYLATHNVATLATHGADGVWAAAVFYVNRGFDLFFLSAPRTRHAQHLAENPQLAVTIQEEYADWRGIQGIQLAGVAHRLTGTARADAIAAYAAKYPFIAAAPPPIARALDKVHWYRIAPDAVYFVDNTRGFGHRDRVL